MSAVLPHPLWLRGINIRAGLVTLEPDWHAEMVELASGKSVDNQAVDAGASPNWEPVTVPLGYRNQDCRSARQSQSAFLSAQQSAPKRSYGPGKSRARFLGLQGWVMGLFWKLTVSPTILRSELFTIMSGIVSFSSTGIRLVQHYDSTDCYVTPDKFVAEFFSATRSRLLSGLDKSSGPGYSGNLSRRDPLCRRISAYAAGDAASV